MPKSYLSCTLIVIIYACFTIELSEGCNRQHTEPYRDYEEDYEDTIQYNIPPEEQEGEYPSGIDYPTPPPEYETTTRRVLVHRALCRMEEEAMMGCLNRGTCVVLELNVRRPVCECPLEFRGSRCQYRSPRLWDEVRQHRLRTAHVAAGVSVCILLVFVLILAIYVYIRCRRKIRHRHIRTKLSQYNRVFEGHRNGNEIPPQFSQQQYNGTGRQGTRTLHPSPQRKSHVIANVSTRGGVKSSLLGDEDNNTACVVATDEKCALDLGRCHNDDTGDRHVSHSNGSHGNITSPTDSTTRCASGV